MYDFVKKQKLNIATAISVVVLVLFYAVGASAKDLPEVFTDDDNWHYSPEPWDYKNGLLDDANFLRNITHDLPAAMIDNDLYTKVSSNETYVIKADEPFNLRGIYAKGSALFGSPFVYVTLSDGTRKSFNRDGDYHEWSVDNVISISIKTSSQNTGRNFEFDIFGGYRTDVYPKVKVLDLDVSHDSATVKFDKPDGAEAVDIWLNGKKIDRTKKDTYVYKDLKPDTKYEFMFINWYGDDNYGGTVREVVTTKQAPPGEVAALQVKADNHKQVNLSWQNPNQSNFEHVTIYRDVVTGGFIQNLLSAVDPMPVAYADAGDDGPTKLFETNGTYFIDHSVEQSTKYEYVVTTTASGVESQGVKKSVTVPAKPTPTPPNTEMGTNDDGDYVVSWTETTGQIKIIVGGQPYVTVAASTGSYTIPEADMSYSLFGTPQVQVVWIDEDGDESTSIAPGPPGSTTGNGGSGGNGGNGGNSGGIGGMPTPITALDVLKGTMSFMLLLSPLILLAIIVYFVPRIIAVIKSALQKRGDIR